MPLDPISYSLIKKKDYITGTSIIYSSTEPEDKSVVWFDTGVRKPKIYDNQSGKWGILGYTIGYSDFDNNLDGTWSRYIDIPITTSSSESVQYKFEINGDNINVYSNDGADILATGTGGLDFWNKVQFDGRDIRVFDETSSQNYFWVEKFDYANRKAIIWVRLNAGQEEVNIAYGNNDCLISSYCNGKMTFEFFDDFSDGSLDGWTILNGGGTGTAYVEKFDGKYMAKLVPANVYNRVAIVYPFVTNNSGYILEVRAITDVAIGDGILLAFSDNTIWSANRDEPQNGYGYSFARGSNSTAYIGVYVNSTGTSLASISENFNPSTYYIIGGSWNDNTLELYENYSKLLSATDSTFSSFDYIHISCAINYWYFDWIRVRKYLSSNISFSIPTIEEF